MQMVTPDATSEGSPRPRMMIIRTCHQMYVRRPLPTAGNSSPESLTLHQMYIRLHINMDSSLSTVHIYNGQVVAINFLDCLYCHKLKLLNSSNYLAMQKQQQQQQQPRVHTHRNKEHLLPANPLLPNHL